MTYRRDIDGLRAIAVLAVVLFHFRLVGLSGGYVGVDIFFVISGYLIGGLIIDETANGSFTYLRFYSRRIKRLFAAFFVMALATIPMAWWLMSPVDFWALSKSIVASTVFVPNLLFYRDAGYFDPGASTKPLLHTWSLAVEEQFYIFFPVVVRLAARAGSRWIPAALLVLTVSSFAYAQYLLAVDPSASFYWLPSRAWELALGALVAIPGLREFALPVKARRALTALSMVALLVPMVWFTEATPFPGMAALPACLATAWFLWSGRAAGGGLVQQGLSATIPVAIGRISYSLYLWHWPVIVFLGYYFDGDAGVPARLAALVAVFVLAVLNWRFVEQPFRYSKAAPRVIFSRALLASVGLAALGFGIWRANGVPQRLAAETRLIADAASDFYRYNDRCVDNGNPDWPGLAHCRIGIDAPPRFLIWGDSHARAIHDGADQLAKENNAAGLLVHAGGCMPAFDIAKTEAATGPRSDAECSAQNKAVQSTLERKTSIRKVLLVGRWAYYAEGHGTGLDEHNQIRVQRLSAGAASRTAGAQAKDVASALAETVQWLERHGYEVFLLEQMPEIPEFSSRKLFSAVRSGRQDAASAIARIGTISVAQLDTRQRTATDALRQAAHGDSTRILATHGFFCRPDTCNAWWEPQPAYYDNNHVTGTTSRRLRQVFLPVVSP